MLVLKSRALQDALRQHVRAHVSSARCPACRSGRCSARRGGTRPRRSPTARPKYDVVILDAPATGHGLDMLRVPKVIVDVVPPGLLRRDAERAWALFQDAKTCGDRARDAARRDADDRDDRARARARRAGAAHRAGRRERRAAAALLARRARRRSSASPRPSTRGAPGDAALSAARDRAVRERVQAESLARLSRELAGAPSRAAGGDADLRRSPRSVRRRARRESGAIDEAARGSENAAPAALPRPSTAGP